MVKKWCKQILAFVFACMLIVGGAFVNVGDTVSAKADESQPTPMDMYLIAGQSNAAGYSKKGVENLTETFENVGYGGEVQRYFRTGDPSTSSYLDYEDFVWGVKSGLGSGEGYVGPEYGMAKVLNERYENTVDGRKAFIFKTAAGGTSLLDKDGAIGTTQGNWGNWYPRSLWEDGYAPNLKTFDENNDATGYLYALFLKNFEHVYNELKANGYAPVVKGFVWMQGCQDLDKPDEYEGVLKTFINDMRADLAEITGDYTLNSTPFIIGKIATSFTEYNRPDVPVFNAMQQRVADEMGNSVATIETSDLIIVEEDGTINGTDQYHFNCADAKTLGERFGEKLLQVAGEKMVGVSSTVGGNVNYVFENDGKLTVSVATETSGDKQYKLKKLLINEIDVTANLISGRYTVDEPENQTFIYVEFVEKTKYSISYSFDKNVVGIVQGLKQIYENNTMQLELGSKKGYRIVEVKINGETVAPTSVNGNAYVIENVTEDLQIQIECEKIPTGGTQANAPLTIGETNNTLIIVCIVGGVVLLGVAAVVVLLVLKKKKNKK